MRSRGAVNVQVKQTCLVHQTELKCQKGGHELVKSDDGKESGN